MGGDHVAHLGKTIAQFLIIAGVEVQVVMAVGFAHGGAPFLVTKFCLGSGYCHYLQLEQDVSGYHASSGFRYLWQ